MSIKTAMVLAAGLGTRMRPLTHDRPKAMVQVRGRCLIDHVLDRLGEAGVARAVVNVHAFADKLEAHLKTRRGGPEIIISDERGALLETGGGLVKARPLLGDDPIFVCNIDAIWIDFENALAALEADWRRGTKAQFLLARQDWSLGYHGAGDFYLNERARPDRRGQRQSAPYVYAGTQILDPRVLNGEAVRRFSLNEIWNRLLRNDQVRASVLQGFWMHVGDPEARRAAEAVLGDAGPDV